MYIAVDDAKGWSHHAIDGYTYTDSAVLQKATAQTYILTRFICQDLWRARYSPDAVSSGLFGITQFRVCRNWNRLNEQLELRSELI